MIGVRHEKYGNSINEYPLSLGINLERTPYNCSKDQNCHANLEIQLCTAGTGTVLLDGEKYTVKKGDIIAVNPDVVHYTFTDSYLRYTCLIISTDWCRQMNINCDTIRFVPFIGDPALADLIGKLADVYPDYGDALRVVKLSRILSEILINLAEKHSTSALITASKSKKIDAVKEAVMFIQKNFNKKFTLSEIAAAVFMDKYTLCKDFKKYTGHTVVEYLHQYRCMKAVDYLSAGFTVTETASLCGFENLSFFTKIFKRYTKNNPSYYKK